MYLLSTNHHTLMVYEYTLHASCFFFAMDINIVSFYNRCVIGISDITQEYLQYMLISFVTSNFDGTIYISYNKECIAFIFLQVQIINLIDIYPLSFLKIDLMNFISIISYNHTKIISNDPYHLECKQSLILASVPLKMYKYLKPFF